MANRLYNEERYEEWLADVRREYLRDYPDVDYEIVPTRYGCEVWDCDTDTLLAEPDYTVAGEEERVRY